MNGKSELKTGGVAKTDTYTYIVLDENTVKYVNTVRDSSADCQEDDEFTEIRIKE